MSFHRSNTSMLHIFYCLDGSNRLDLDIDIERQLGDLDATTGRFRGREELNGYHYN